MRRRSLIAALVALLLWGLATLAVGTWLLPPMLLAATNPDLTIVPGAGHCEASNRLPGGWGAWANLRLQKWGF